MPAPEALPKPSARLAAEFARKLPTFAEELARLYAEAEGRLLWLLTQKDGGKPLTEWRKAYTKQQVRQIRAQLQELESGVVATARREVPLQYRKSLAATDASIAGQDLAMTQLHSAAIEQLVGAAIDPHRKNIARCDKLWKRAYSNANVEALGQAFTEGLTVRQTQKRLLGVMKREGLYAFRDSAGRVWDPRAYATMAARTVSRETTQAAMLNRMAETGRDLLVISTHSGACPLCEPWEGEIVSATGATPGYATLGDAESSGYGHPNCEHTEGPYVEGLALGVREHAPGVQGREGKLADIGERRIIAKEEFRLAQKEARAAYREKLRVSPQARAGKARKEAARAERKRESIREQLARGRAELRGRFEDLRGRAA